MRATFEIGRKVQPVSANPSPEDGEALPSLELIFEETKRVSSHLERQFAHLDSKANFQLGAGTVVAAAAAVVNQSRQSSHALFRQLNTVLCLPISGERLLTIVTGLALSAFVLALVCSFMGYKLRPYVDAPTPSKLQRDYMTHSEQYTMQAILGRLAENYDSNYAEAQRKQLWVQIAHWAILAQGVCFAFIVVLCSDWS